MDKVSQDYWDQSYSSYQYGVADDAVTRWLVRHLPPSPGTVFEPGCFPGRYLAFFGKKGWKVSGMDLTPRVETDFKSWLTEQKIDHDRIERGDVLSYLASTADRYDLVVSFGFIEHFENFSEVVALHDKVMKPGGMLIITTPNFAGRLQHFLHRWLDDKNLQRHHLPSMRPALWKDTLNSLGYEFRYCGYFGHFDFWADQQPRSRFNTICLKILNRLSPLLGWLPDSRSWSPYCGLVAVKK